MSIACESGPGPGPLLTLEVHEVLRSAARCGRTIVECSLDLGLTVATVEVDGEGWIWRGARYGWLENCKERTIYRWAGASFEPVARYTTALIKLVPTEYGAPTFEIDGIKMLPTSRESPYADAERKVALVAPRGKVVLDTCGGLGYFAAWCLRGGATQVLSYEKNADVIWLRSLNPWSPQAGGALTLTQGDIVAGIGQLSTGAVGAVLHDPPRFGIAGELYSLDFYRELHRVLRRGGRLFHYTGAPNKLTSGRNVPAEVIKRLRDAGFEAKAALDGVLATRR